MAVLWKKCEALEHLEKTVHSLRAELRAGAPAPTRPLQGCAVGAQSLADSDSLLLASAKKRALADVTNAPKKPAKKLNSVGKKVSPGNIHMRYRLSKLTTLSLPASSHQPCSRMTMSPAPAFHPTAWVICAPTR